MAAFYTRLDPLSTVEGIKLNYQLRLRAARAAEEAAHLQLFLDKYNWYQVREVEDRVLGNANNMMSLVTSDDDPRGIRADLMSGCTIGFFTCDELHEQVECEIENSDKNPDLVTLHNKLQAQASRFPKNSVLFGACGTKRRSGNVCTGGDSGRKLIIAFVREHILDYAQRAYAKEYDSSCFCLVTFWSLLTGYGSDSDRLAHCYPSQGIQYVQDGCCLNRQKALYDIKRKYYDNSTEFETLLLHPGELFGKTLGATCTMCPRVNAISSFAQELSLISLDVINFAHHVKHAWGFDAKWFDWGGEFTEAAEPMDTDAASSRKSLNEKFLRQLIAGVAEGCFHGPVELFLFAVMLNSTKFSSKLEKHRFYFLNNFSGDTNGNPMSVAINEAHDVVGPKRIAWTTREVQTVGAILMLARGDLDAPESRRTEFYEELKKHFRYAAAKTPAVIRRKGGVAGVGPMFLPSQSLEPEDMSDVTEWWYLYNSQRLANKFRLFSHDVEPNCDAVGFLYGPAKLGEIVETHMVKYAEILCIAETSSEGKIICGRDELPLAQQKLAESALENMQEEVRKFFTDNYEPSSRSTLYDFDRGEFEIIDKVLHYDYQFPDTSVKGLLVDVGSGHGRLPQLAGGRIKNHPDYNNKWVGAIGLDIARAFGEPHEADVDEKYYGLELYGPGALAEKITELEKENFKGQNVKTRAVTLVYVLHHVPIGERERLVQDVFNSLDEGGLVYVREHALQGPNHTAFLDAMHVVTEEMHNKWHGHGAYAGAASDAMQACNYLTIQSCLDLFCRGGRFTLLSSPILSPTCMKQVDFVFQKPLG